MVIDYSAEAKKLDEYKPGENSIFWKPTPGKHQVKFLSELDDADPFIEDGKAPQPRAKIDLMIGTEQKTWTFGKGNSPASTFSQLVRLAQEHSNSLVGVSATIVVVNDGKRNKYTIV